MSLVYRAGQQHVVQECECRVYSKALYSASGRFCLWAPLLPGGLGEAMDGCWRDLPHEGQGALVYPGVGVCVVATDENLEPCMHKLVYSLDICARTHTQDEETNAAAKTQRFIFFVCVLEYCICLVMLWYFIAGCISFAR